MPRKPDFKNVRPAMQTIDQRRPHKCFERLQDGLVTEHDTIEEAVRTAGSDAIKVRHHYQDRYDGNGDPTQQLSESQLGQLESLLYCRFIKPFIVEVEEDENERY